jgi:hypothetical protein
LQQQVAARQQRNHHALNDDILTDNDFADALANAADKLLGGLGGSGGGGNGGLH